jgi:hypothetical protein
MLLGVSQHFTFNAFGFAQAVHDLTGFLVFSGRGSEADKNTIFSNSFLCFLSGVVDRHKIIPS